MKKKGIIAVTLLISAFFFAGCGQKYYKEESKKVEKAMKSIYKEKKKTEGCDYPKNIDEALAQYNFDAARTYLSCYTLSDEVIKGWIQSAWLTTQSADAKRCYDITYDKMNEKVTVAEVTYAIKKGEYNRAEQVARENGKDSLYEYLIVQEIPTMLNTKKYEEVINILSSWKFKEDYKTEVIDAYYDSDYYNSSYNSEVSTFNDIVDNLLVKAIFESNTELARKCLLLYVPNAICSSKIYTRSNKYKHKYHTFKYVLKNTYKEAAQKKLKEAGMQI